MNDWSICPKCGSPNVIPRSRVLDRSNAGADRLTVQIDRNPNALVFTNSQSAELRARICGACGYTELYATNPGLLWEAFQEAARRQAQE